MRTDYYINPLPEVVPQVGGGTSIVGDADLRHTWTDYCGNFIYENDSLKQTLVEGGYISYAYPQGTSPANQATDISQLTPTYHFYVQDHLGNNRLVVNEAGTIEQVNHYYLFGGLMGESRNITSAQRYKYNGKELDRMHGLDWYDYGARHYDATIARWMCVDPLAEKYYHVSPYAYCLDNPIRYVDPDGKWNWDINGNLTSGNNDNEKTLAEFLNTTLYNAGLLLFAHRQISNNKDQNINKGVILSKENLWIMESDLKGEVVNNTREAVYHYYYGNGTPVDVGDESTTELLNSEEFQTNLKVITTKNRTENKFSVDLTRKTFHIGRTPVKYKVYPGEKSSHVVFTLFEGDSFRDPLDIGIEIRGIPYAYKPRKITYFFKPVNKQIK